MSTEDLVKRILEENFNLQVEKIPESDKQTPDFLAYDCKNKYLIEVKGKEGNPKTSNAREKAFSQDEIFKISESLESKNILQDIIRKGRGQIKAHVEDMSIFRIVWVHCTGLTYDATMEQIHAGIYGSETVVECSKSDDAFSGTCYYFGFSQFFKYKETIDAVMITGQRGEAVLCLNNFSPRYSSLKKSSFVKSMTDGVIDPIYEKTSGTAIIMDGDLDRKKPAEVLKYLQKKYKIEKLNVMKISQMEVQMAIPDFSQKKRV